MTRPGTPDYSLQKFYLLGREDAEEDFDPEDFDLAELALSATEAQADLRETLRKAVEAYLAMDDFDGGIADWRDQYTDELTGLDESEARALWRRGYLDEALLELEDEVVDQMSDMFEVEALIEREPRGARGGESSPLYGAYAKDGNKDAVESWDLREMEDVIGNAIYEVDHSGWMTTTDRDAAVKRASKTAAEAYQNEVENEAEAKETWLEQHGDDARDAGLNPEVAYDKYWRPAFVATTATLIEEIVADRVQGIGARVGGGRR